MNDVVLRPRRLTNEEAAFGQLAEISNWLAFFELGRFSSSSSLFKDHGVLSTAHVRTQFVLDNVGLVSILSFIGKGHFLFAALVSKKWAEAYKLITANTTYYASALESELCLLEAKEYGFDGGDLQRPSVA
jgi:hypothetical protein